MNPKVFDMTPQGHLYNSGPFCGVPGRNKKQLRESTEQHEQLVENTVTKKKTLHPCRSIALRFFCLGKDLDERDIRSIVSACVYDPVVQFLLCKKKNMYIYIYIYIYMNTSTKKNGKPYLFFVDKTSSEGIAPEAFYILYTRCMQKRVKHAQPCP